MSDDKPYQFSHNPSDGIDTFVCGVCGLFHWATPACEPPPEWGVWRTSYADHGGEG